MRRRRRRNSPYGATEAEYRHVRGNPRSRPIGHIGNSGVVLGTLDELVVEQRGGPRKVERSRLQGLYLAWLPAQRNFAIVRKAKARPGAISSEAVRLHREFHDTAPTAVATYHAPDRDSSVRDVGLLRSLTYVIPPSIRSPQKTGFKWVHLFGDHGESGHGAFRGEKKYPDSLKPMLQANDAGELFIKRRPGNKYRVTKWIYW